MRCAKHPNVETVVRCGRCETPVCPKCSVFGPAGIRCKDCASLRSSPLYQVPPGRMVAGVAAGVATGIAGGWLLAAGAGVGFFIIWGGVLLGGAVAEVLLRVTGRKRGIQMEVAAGACVVLGALVGLALRSLPGSPAGLPADVLGSILGNWFYDIAVAIAAASAVSRIRYL